MFNNTSRLLKVFLDREVRRCVECHGYGRVKASCRGTNPSCGKCANPNPTLTTIKTNYEEMRKL